MYSTVRRVESITALVGTVCLVTAVVVGIGGMLFEGISEALPIFAGGIGAVVALWTVSFASFRIQFSSLSEETVRWLEAGTVAVVSVGGGVVLYFVAAMIWNVVTGQSATFVDLISQWDAGWYASIVWDGYHEHRIQSGITEGQANWAFFPLYPLLVWILTALTGISVYLAGTVVSVIALTVGGAFAYRYLVLTRSRQVARLAVGLLAIGPYSFYAYTLYTEALFICLVAIAFWALRTDRYVMAATAGGLLSATRALGVMFGVAMLLHLILRTDAFDPLRRTWPPSTNHEAASTAWETLTDRRVLALGLVPTGLLSYMLYLWWHVGNPLAFAAIQSAWGRSFGNPFARLVHGLLASGFHGQYLAVAGLLGLIAAVDLVRRGRPAEGTFALLLLLVPMSSGLISLPRYAFGTAVLVFAAADWLSRTEVSQTVGFGLLVAFNAILVMLWYARHPYLW